METNCRKIIIMRGIPGSGKTTKAKSYVNKGFKKVGKDELRRMINDYSLDNSDENMIQRIQEDVIKNFMTFGRNIVIDNTHARYKYIDSLIKYITAVKSSVDYDYSIEIDFIDTPLDVCLERNSKRGSDVVPESVIRKMYNEIHS